MPTALPTIKQRDAYYVWRLTFGEMENKVAYQSSTQIYRKFAAHIDTIAQAKREGNERKARRAFQRVEQIYQREVNRFDREVRGKMTSFALRAERSRYTGVLGLLPRFKRRRVARQKQIVEQTSFNKETKAVTPSRANQVLLNRLRKNTIAFFNEPDERLAAQRFQGIRRQFIAQQTTVHKTQLVHATEQGHLRAIREIATEYTYLTQNDASVDDTCDPYHNQTYKFGEGGPEPPLHYNCRCTVEPVTAETRQLNRMIQQGDDARKWFDANIDKITREALNAKTLGTARGARARGRILKEVRRTRSWVSNKTYLNTKGAFNDAQGRQALRSRAKQFGVDIRIPKPLTGQRPQAILKSTRDRLYSES